MIRPTPRAVMLFCAGLPVALFVLVHDAALWPLSFDACLLALLVIAIDGLISFSPRQLVIEVKAPARLPVGETGRATLTLSAPPLRRALEIEALIDMVGPADPALPNRISFAGNASRYGLAVGARRRGVVTLQNLWLRWRGPLGLIERRVLRRLDLAIDILPSTRAPRGTELRLLTDSAIYGTKSQNQKGEGSEFETLREHVAGLDSRFIDWKQSARHRKLLSKEFRIERNHQIVLAFDTGHLMLEPIEGLARLDHAIEAGLMLGWVGLRSGDLVGAYGFDVAVRHYTEPGRGVPYFARLQRGAARLDYRSEETNFTLGLAELNARLKRRALVVLFTEFVDSVMAELLIESLKRMANRHVVIFVTMQDPMMLGVTQAEPDNFDTIARAVVAQDFLRERSIVLERIARLGVHCLDVPVGGLSVGLLNRYLEIKQTGLL